MTTSKHFIVPRVALSEQTIASLDAPRVADHAGYQAEQVWPIERAVSFWVLLSAGGWLAGFGFVRYLF